jgi:hypothetical protein
MLYDRQNDVDGVATAVNRLFPGTSEDRRLFASLIHERRS